MLSKNNCYSLLNNKGVKSMGLMSKTLVALSLAATTMTAAVFAGEDKITKGYNSMDAMGCMLVLECTKDVEAVSYTHLRAHET